MYLKSIGMGDAFRLRNIMLQVRSLSCYICIVRTLTYIRAARCHTGAGIMLQRLRKTWHDKVCVPRRRFSEHAMQMMIFCGAFVLLQALRVSYGTYFGDVSGR